MLGSSPAVILARLEAALGEQVAPHVVDEEALRQLDAARSLLRRMARSWVTPGPWADLDAGDQAACLVDVLALVNGASWAGDWVHRRDSDILDQELVIELECKVRADRELPAEVREAALERFRYLHMITSRRALMALGVRRKDPL